ncbi:hypothetical protein Tsubulata_036043, partial [Turnera subulata]
LDGPTLAAASCASTELHALSTDEKLWQKICTSTWPSISDPRISDLISTFPSGHRSFFSDAYPLLHHRRSQGTTLDRPVAAATTPELISAVDIYYKNAPIFSKVAAFETLSSWFMSSPFRVELLEPKEFFPTTILHHPSSSEKDLWLKHLEENITLSWIVIDPKEKRALNLSSRKAVSVQRHWLTGEVEVKFATVMAGDGARGSAAEEVECEMVVTCGEKEGGEVQVRQVWMGMMDMEGRNLSGNNGLVILQGAMEAGERKKEKSGKEGIERYEEFVDKKKQWKDRNERREKVLDMACVVSGISVFVSFWSLVLYMW